MSVKNLYPKFNQCSKITPSVMGIINDVLNNPVKISNCIDNNHSFNKKHISPYKKTNHIAEYTHVNEIDFFLKNYKSNRRYWDETPFSQKKEVFLKTADLIENKYYEKMLAYTIVGQNKTLYEAEIDCINELVDFLRFNVHYAEQILEKQPISTEMHNNISEYNCLNGFVAAITPFNFTAIAGNLASAPLLFGNSVLWKPSDSSMLSNYLFYEIIHEAGLPKGVLNFCPMEPSNFLNQITSNKELAGLLFTGSSEVFDNIYKKIGKNITNYNNYPRLIGETGGKNFHFMHQSFQAQSYIDFFVKKTLESAFNFSGQKCSACSVAYVPKKYKNLIILSFKSQIDKYMSSMENYGLINEDSYERVNDLLDELHKDNDIEFILEDSSYNKNTYEIKPHIVTCNDHCHEIFRKEYFGPVLSIYFYDDHEMDYIFSLINESNKYALTGSIFSLDERFIEVAREKFKFKTGNFYINDKSTGSVVGQQPFGGSGKSGTNDKAGDINMLYRLFNQRNTKINYELF
tara:strand:+ start:384 stop:1934 length:1551 start_codon:yes stop_codon:yes gene_type:complete